MVEALDDIVCWVLGFGDQVEVIKPDELRVAIRKWAERIARRYSEASTILHANGSESASHFLPSPPGNGRDHATGQNGQTNSMDG